MSIHHWIEEGRQAENTLNSDNLAHSALGKWKWVPFTRNNNNNQATGTWIIKSNVHKNLNIVFCVIAFHGLFLNYQVNERDKVRASVRLVLT